MVVTSSTWLLAGLTSPPPVTLAELMTETAAFDATSTVTVIGGYAAPGLSGSFLPQVTDCPVMSQVQPVPLAAVGIRPVGTISIAVTRSLVGMPPLLATVMM